MRAHLSATFCNVAVVLGLVTGGACDGEPIVMRLDGPAAPPILEPEPDTTLDLILSFSLISWSTAARAEVEWVAPTADACTLTAEVAALYAHAVQPVAREGTTRLQLPPAAVYHPVTLRLRCTDNDGRAADQTLTLDPLLVSRSVSFAPPSAPEPTDVQVCISPARADCEVATPGLSQIWPLTDGSGCSTAPVDSTTDFIVSCPDGEAVGRFGVGATILSLSVEPAVRAEAGPAQVSWDMVYATGCEVDLPQGTRIPVDELTGSVEVELTVSGDVTMDCPDVDAAFGVTVGPTIAQLGIDIVTHAQSLDLNWSAPGATSCDYQLRVADEERRAIAVPNAGARSFLFDFDAAGDVQVDVTCRNGDLESAQSTVFGVPFIDFISVDQTPLADWVEVCFSASGLGDGGPDDIGPDDSGIGGGTCRIIVGADWYYPLAPESCVEVMRPGFDTTAELYCEAESGRVVQNFVVESGD